MNKKYKITDIVHPENPKLHRIKALCDIGKFVKAGDLGGYVEKEDNLSFAPKDTAWLYDDAVACDDAVVEKGASLQNRAVACDHAMVTQNAELFDDARAEDDAYIKGGRLYEQSRATGASMLLPGDYKDDVPSLCGTSVVYGRVQGNIHLKGSTVVLCNENLYMPNRDRLEIDSGNRKVISRAEQEQRNKKPQKKDMER